MKIRYYSYPNGKQKLIYKGLGIFIKPSDWDEVKCQAKRSHPYAAEVNLRLMTEWDNLHKNQILGKSVMRPNCHDLVSYYEMLLPSYKIKYSVAYYLKLDKIKNKMAEFGTWSFEEINTIYLKNYEAFLIKRKNHKNTIYDDFKRIKMITRFCCKDGFMAFENNPILDFNVMQVDTKKERLVYDDILKFNQINIGHGEAIWHTKNRYLFSFYCAGIRFKDVCLLTWDNVKDGRLTYAMNKGGKKRDIKLLPMAVEILEHYKENKHFIFGMFSQLPKTKEDLHAKISALNAVDNQNLKRIGNILKLPTAISFHTSRHSFADFAKIKGLDIHTIKELLGHSRVSTTEIYLRSFFTEESDAHFEKMFT